MGLISKIYGTQSKRGGLIRSIYGSSENNTTSTSSSEALPEVKNKPSNLDRVFGLLNSFETAPAVYAYLEGNNPVSAYGESAVKGLTLQGMGNKRTYKDVLEKLGVGDVKLGPISSRQLGGIALDILLDPTTYIGSGLIKTGIKPIKKLGALSRKIPVAGEKIESANKLIRELFEPGARLKMSGKQGADYWDAYKQMIFKTKGEESQVVGKVSQTLKNLKASGLNSDVILKGEKGLANLSPKEAKAAKPIFDMFEDMAKEESSRGLLKTTQQNYLPHILSDPARKMIADGKADLAGWLHPLRPKLNAAKTRGITGTIKSINEEFIQKHGFPLFEENVLKIASQRGISSVRARNAYDFIQAAGIKFGVPDPEKIGSKMVNGLRYTQSTAPGLKGVLLPQEIQKHLDQTYLTLTNDNAVKGLVGLYDKLQSIWKVSVTSLHPSFHGRNAISGVYMNWLGGMGPQDAKRYIQIDDILRKSDGAINLGGKTWKFAEIKDAMAKNGLLNAPGYTDVARSNLVDPTLLNKITDIPQATTAFIENRLRGSLFLHNLAKGKSVWESTKEVYRYQFDYLPQTGLTVFEKEFMKRLIPFYTWLRNSVPLLVNTAIEKPGKLATTGKVLRELLGDLTPEEKARLPQYLRESYPLVKTGGTKEDPEFLYSVGLPVEDLNRLTPTKLASQLSPFIKYPIETLTGKNLYFNKQIKDVNTAPEIMEAAPQWFKNFMGYNEKNNTVNPDKLHFLNTFAGRWLFTGDRLYRKDTEGLMKAAYFLTGVKGAKVNLKQQDFYRKKEELQRQQQELEKQGILKEYKVYYQPK